MDGFSLNMSAPEQWLGMIGSSLILIAYFFTVEHPEKRGLYCSISLAGAMLLLIVALIYRNLGLIMLEVVWISINIWGLWKAFFQVPVTPSPDKG
jgi:hypothetical protein